MHQPEVFQAIANYVIKGMVTTDRFEMNVEDLEKVFGLESGAPWFTDLEKWAEKTNQPFVPKRGGWLNEITKDPTQKVGFVPK